MQEWTRISSEQVADYKIFRASKDVCRSPRTGAHLPFVVLEGPDWVNVVAIDQEGRWVCVRQFRMGSRSLALEIPGGMIDAGETPLQAAQRELLEETGYTSDNWRELGWVHPNPAFQLNRCFTYLAQDCKLTGQLQQDPGEDIEVLFLSEAEIMKSALDGTITHSLVLTGIFFWQNRARP